MKFPLKPLKTHRISLRGVDIALLWDKNALHIGKRERGGERAALRASFQFEPYLILYPFWLGREHESFMAAMLVVDDDNAIRDMLHDLCFEAHRCTTSAYD